jgi:hypothetical protein
VRQGRRQPSHVAIVGCGFTGTTVFHQLVRHYPIERITIFEASGDFGPGFPYRIDESQEYLINNSNDTMCLEPSNRRAFVEWLRQHPTYTVGLDEKGNMPRAVYGEFLRDVCDRTAAEAATQGVQVDFVASEVIDIDEDAAGKVTVHCRGSSTRADMVILATGRCPERDVFELTDANDGSYFSMHMPGSKLDDIPLDAECHVLGASLSAYDVVNQLFAPATGCKFLPDGENRLRYEPNQNRRRVVLCSRSGRLKKVQSRNPWPIGRHIITADAVRKLVPGEVTLAELFEMMLSDAKALGVDIDRESLADPYAGCDDADSLNQRAAEILAADIDAAASTADSNANFIVDYLDAAQMELWDIFASRALSAEQESLYRSRYETAMLSYAAPCPSTTAQKILALMRSGHLHIVRGVGSVTADNDHKSFRIDHSFGTEFAHCVLNATGSVDRNVESERQTVLVATLAAKGILQAYQRECEMLDGISVDMNTFRSLGCHNIYIANMFLWGPGLYVSSAIMMASIVERILSAAFASGPD